MQFKILRHLLIQNYGIDVREQKIIDYKMIDLDGTEINQI